MPHTLLFAALMIAGTFFLGYNDVQNKKALNLGIHPQLLVGIPFFIGGAVLLAFVWVFMMPEIQSGFWAAWATTVVLNVVLQYAFMRAFSAGDASFVAPLRLLIPPLVIFTGFLFLRETPSLTGVLGIGITLAGFWFLFAPEFSERHEGRARNTEALLFGLLGCALSSVSFIFDKLSVVYSSGAFATAAISISVGALTILIMLLSKHTRSALADVKTMAAHGGLFGSITLMRLLGMFLTTQALQYSLVAYASSLKRLQAFWTVLLSGHLLGEKRVFERFAAAGIMFLGILLTVLWS